MGCGPSRQDNDEEAGSLSVKVVPDGGRDGRRYKEAFGPKVTDRFADRVLFDPWGAAVEAQGGEMQAPSPRGGDASIVDLRQELQAMKHALEVWDQR